MRDTRCSDAACPISTWSPPTASCAYYARLWPELFEPALIDATVDFLQDLARAGRVLEFGIGTGRVALPLSRRGVDVCGIELSQAMADELRRQDAGLPVVVGDFATAWLDGTFSLVYVLRNTITNLTTQDEQVEAFRNAAAHLGPGGYYVVENYVPELQRLPPGETTHVFVATPDHVGFEEYDLGAQIAVSRHYWVIDGGSRPSFPHIGRSGRPSSTSWRDWRE